MATAVNQYERSGASSRGINSKNLVSSNQNSVTRGRQWTMKASAALTFLLSGIDTSTFSLKKASHEPSLVAVAANGHSELKQGQSNKTWRSPFRTSLDFCRLHR